jgi:ectoine hydroxylase-related dioxygenase (phytanoyl-CoA dioxygenase family)
MELAAYEHSKKTEFKHRSENYVEYGNTSWYLEIDPQISSKFDARAVEINRGSVIVFSHLTPHRSLVNKSKSCRFSIDLRYLPSNAIAGTNQKPIAFRRADPKQREQVMAQKNAYLKSKLAQDRNLWRHEITSAPWKERWENKS